MTTPLRLNDGASRGAAGELLAIPGYLGTLWAQRELLRAWVEREVRVRYKQSLIGGLWAVVQPVALMLIFTFVFSVVAQVATDGIPYPLFAFVALLPWTFFSTAVSFGVPSLVNNMNLVTKIYFPREILPIANVAAAGLDFLVASVVFVGLMLVYGVAFSWTLLWLPLLLAVQLLLTLGIVLGLAAVNVFFRDVRFVIPLALQLWMYASPIAYPVSLVPERFRALYMLNPMAGLIDSYRRVILGGQPPVPEYLGVAAILSLLVFIVGYGYFKHSEGAFADMI